MTRTCARCGEELPLSEYGKVKSKCKECVTHENSIYQYQKRNAKKIALRQMFISLKF